MLKENWRFIANIARVADNAIVVSMFFISYHVREALIRESGNWAISLPQTFTTLGPIEAYYVVLGVAVPFYNGALSMMGAYRSMRFLTLFRLIQMMLVASAVVFLCQGSVLFLLKLDLSRTFVGLYCLLCAVGLLVERIVVLRLLRYWRMRGKNYRNLLIAGTGEQAHKIWQEIQAHPELGVNVAGFAALEESQHWEAPSRLQQAVSQPYPASHLVTPVIATPQSFEAALKRHTIDEVLFTDATQYFPTIEELAQIAAEEGVRVTLAADLFSLKIFQSDISYFGSVPLIHYHPFQGDGLSLFAKRMLDIALSGVALAILSPLLLVTALAIKLESKGPVFFRQQRIGLNGRIFTLLKFRSMIQDAEKLLPALRHRNEMQGPVFKLKHDPRVTWVGKWIRRFSIDELPQLINVLRGDMSLVGPRPPLPEEVSEYVRKHRRRLSMRPGITCTWQVSGRNENPDFEKWMELDLDYVDNWSLKKDITLLLKTIPAVITGSGAR